MALIGFECETCGKSVEVYRSPSQLVKAYPRFCSLVCLGISQKGDGNPSYTGGRHVLSIGYAVVLLPDHPNSDSRGYVYEHRLVAERKIGRSLIPGEIVHHINGEKLDNRPENLEVLASQGDHLKSHDPLINPNPLRREDHPMARLDESKVEAIRLLYKTGEKQSKIADLFNMSRSQINNIVNNKQWVEK